MTLDTYTRSWMENPDGGGLFTGQRDLISVHDHTCASLHQVWLPRRQGTSCPSDLDDCEDCRLTFYNEGVGMYDTDTGWDVLLCQCCARKRGLT